MSTALSRSPPHSCSALLQSIMPAPVRARSSATSFVGISFTEVIASFPFPFLIKTPPSRRGSPGAAVGVFIQLELLRLLPADGFRGRRRLFRFQAGRDRFGLRAPLPPRRPLLAITLHIGLTRLGRVRRAFSFFARRGLTQGHLPPGFGDHIRDRARDQGDRANRVVVSWNRNGDQ